MDISKSINKLKNFARNNYDSDDDSLSGMSEKDIEKIKADLLSGDSSLTRKALNDALSSFAVHDDLKSNAAFMKSFKQKNPKGYEEFEKYSAIIEDKKSKMPSAKEQEISATKKIRNIETMNKIGEALSKTMEEPLAGIFTSLLEMLSKRSADAIKIAAMKDDATGLSLLDEAAALSNDGGEALKEAGAEVDDKAVTEEREAIANGKGKSPIAAAGAIPVTTQQQIKENTTKSSDSQITPSNIEVTDEDSARKLGEELGKIVHGDNFDQDIFDDIFDKALDQMTNDDGDTDWDAVAAYLKNIYRSAYHKEFSSRIDKSIEKLNKVTD